jgi:hypothetical protein
MSESLPPGTTSAIAASSAASVVFTSRSASALGAIPTNTVTAASAWNPSQIAPKSSDSSSPSSSRRSVDGIPCTISSFTEAQIVAGNGVLDAPR